MPYAAGSATDLIPRTIFDVLGAKAGHTFIVENRLGGGTTVAANAAARRRRRHSPQDRGVDRKPHRAGAPREARRRADDHDARGFRCRVAKEVAIAKDLAKAAHTAVQ